MACPRRCTARRTLDLHTFDATCPLVTKVHNEVKRFARDGYQILLIGHEGHEEVEGTAGEAPDRVHLVDGAASIEALDFGPEEKLVWLSQTTLSVDETLEMVDLLKKKFPTSRIRRATTFATPPRTVRSP